MKRRPKNNDFAYRAVYRYLLELIGQMAPGGCRKLPSLRDLAQRLNASISTIQYAYSLLEHEGRVQSVPKSGYFAKGGAAVHNATGQELLPDLHCAGNAQLPSLEGDLLGIERQLLRKYSRPAGPAHPSGEFELRAALAARYTRSVQLYWNADDVYLAPDLRSLFDTLLAALGLQGSTVLVSSPCSWRVLRTLQAAGLQVIELPLGDDGSLDIELFASLLKHEPVRMVMLASHLNSPHGSRTQTAQHQAIAQLLNLHGVWLLENDLDAEYCFAPGSQAYLRTAVDPQRLLVFSTLERTVGAEAPYAYLLSRHCQQQLQHQFLLRDFCLPPLRQQAVARLYAKGRVDLYLEQLRQRWFERVSHLHQQLQAQLGAHLHFQMPEGGTAIWAKAHAPLNSSVVLGHVMRHGLVIEPGEIYSVQGDYRQHLLLGWPVGGEADLQAGLDVLVEALQRAEKKTKQ